LRSETSPPLISLEEAAIFSTVNMAISHIQNQDNTHTTQIERDKHIPQIISKVFISILFYLEELEL